MGRYLIGGRFLAEDKTGPLLVTDSKGKLREIFGKEPIEVPLLYAYEGDDVYWLLDRVSLGSYKEGKVVIKGDELVSYSILEDDKFYINHYGQEFLVSIAFDMRRDILIDGKYLKVIGGRSDNVHLTYAFLGDKVTPIIHVIGVRSKAACFPEFNKIYNEVLYIDNCWGCLNVCLRKKQNENEILYLYVLFGNGEEDLVYEGPSLYLGKLPRLHRMGNIMVVTSKHVEGLELAKDFRRIPGFAYLYVNLTGDVYISFNLRRWEKVEKASKLIFKRVKESLIGNKTGPQSYFSVDGLKKFAKRLSEVPPLQPQT